MSAAETFNAILKKAQELGASDVHVCAGGPFRMRLRGQMMPVAGLPPLSPDDTSAIAAVILLHSRKVPQDQVPTAVAELHDIDCSYSVPGVGRFRVNLCSQRGSISAVLRSIPDKIPDFEALNLPPVLADIAMEERGLVLLTGTTGSGKSSTLAAMVGYVNHR